jgi:DNA repair protein RadC
LRHFWLAHNHPNTNFTPGKHSKVLTRAIVLATETVHLKVFGHMILSALKMCRVGKASLS